MNPVTSWRSGHLGVFIICLILLVLAVFVHLFKTSSEKTRARQLGQIGKYQSTCLPDREFLVAHAEESSIMLQLAVSSEYEDLVKGLSGTFCLGSQEGMLFVFQKPGLQGIWMKDMLMPLDILWLDEDKEIAHIEEKVSQYSYPQIFQPKTPTKYVIELPEGNIQRFSYKIGDKFIF